MQLTTIYFIFTFLICHVDSEEGHKFYLSHNGTDTNSCGHNPSGACRTLSWLLSVFYRESHVNRTVLPKLDLVTDTSLAIAPNMLKIHPWISDLDVGITRWKDYFNPILFEVNSISITGGSWYIYDINTLFKNCIFKSFKLTVNNSMNNAVHSENNVTFLRTYHTNPRNTTSKSFVKVTNGNIYFLNVTIADIHDNSIDGMIQATSKSNVHFMSSNISRNNVSNSFMNITYNSSLHLDDCTIENNYNDHGTFINSIKNNQIIIEKSNFTKNKVGRCIMAFNNTGVFVTESTFYQNNFQLIWAEYYSSIYFLKSTLVKNIGTILGLYYRCSLVIEKCRVINNSLPVLGACITVAYEMKLSIQDSIFLNNTGRDSGVLRISHSYANITNVSFGGNSAIQGSCLDIQHGAKVKVTNSIFYENTGGSVIYVEPSNALFLQDSQFVNHSSPSDSLMEIHNSKLIMIKCTINQNKMGPKGGIVQATKSSNITVAGCSFNSNIGRYGSIFYLSRQSVLIVEDTVLQHNVAYFGGCVYMTDSNIEIKGCNFTNNTGYIKGGAIASERSNITVKDSNFTYHNSTLGGVLAIVDSTLMAHKCIFKNNSANSGGVIYKLWSGEVTLDHCILSMNIDIYGSIWHYYYNRSILRLSNTNCSTCAKCGACVFFVVQDGYHPILYTLNLNIYTEKFYLSSTKQNFLNQSLKHGMITRSAAKIHWQESSFASVVPVSCGRGCNCYYNYSLDYNVYNCSSVNLTELPKDDNLTNITNLLDISHNQIDALCDEQNYFRTVRGFNLSNNIINKICESAISTFHNGSIKTIDLSNNNITTLSSKLSNISSLQSVRLSGNRFLCNCDMTWMINWFDKTTSTGKRIVEDYDQILCHSGMMIGKQIYKLTSEEMGCYPHVLSLGEKVTIGILGTLIIVIVIAIIAISRRWNEVKWLLYLHFNILDKNDRNEDLTDKKYDAFVSYSIHDSEFVRDVFMKDDDITLRLEDDFNFNLILHERDFVPGVTIQANIVDAIQHSRRMFMILSRNYIDSGWCMEEFKMAHFEMVKGQKKYLVPILKEPIDIDSLPRDLRDLQMYLRTYTYIDGTKHMRDINRLRKKIRFAMPGKPLSEYRRMNNDHVQNIEENANDDEQVRNNLAAAENPAIYEDLPGTSDTNDFHDNKCLIEDNDK